MTFEQWWSTAVDYPEKNSDEKQLASAAWERALIAGEIRAWAKIGMEKKRKEEEGK